MNPNTRDALGYAKLLRRAGQATRLEVAERVQARYGLTDRELQSVMCTAWPEGAPQVNPMGSKRDMAELARLRSESALDVLARSPGGRLLRTAEDVDAYVQRERESWEGESQ